VNTSKNKAIATIIAVILLMSSAVLVMNNKPVNAAAGDTQVAGPLPEGVTPSVQVETIAYLSFRPNPVGVGQTVLVNVWLPPIHVARNFTDAYVVTITDPDGNKEVKTLSSYPGDATSWFEFAPDEAGTWKLKFEFIGTYFPEQITPDGGIFAPSVHLDSAYYKPSSTPELNLTVQQDPVPSWPASPLPTDYWTRPVSPENREWWPILGSYPPDGIVGGGDNWPADTNTYMSNYAFIPYVQGPTTAHVLRKQQFMIGGLVGGPAGTISNVAGGLSGSGYPTLIYSGRCYESYSKPGTGSSAQTYWKCYDLRTGEIYWDQPAITTVTSFFGMTFVSALVPTFIEYGAQGAEVAGATAREGVTVTLDAISGGRLIKWDPWSGAIVTNVTGPPSGVSSGTLGGYPYVYSIQSIGYGPSAQYRLIKWTVENNAGNWVTAGGGMQPTVDNFTERIKGNISWPFSSLGTVDFETGVAVVTQAINSPGTGVAVGERVMAASLKNQRPDDNNLLWNVTTDLSSGLEIFFAAPSVADHGKFAARMQNGEWWAWDLNTGQIAWKSESTWPWGRFGGYDVQSAYGLLFSEDYDGIRAINWTNGNIEWHFHAPTPYPYETYYEGDYSFHSAGMVADGMLYTFNTEHTPSQPITRGWRLFCINATTGENVWNITCGQGIPGSRYFQGAIADGYLCMTNEYDGYTYYYGKGPSATTVTAPGTGIALGDTVTITGTVTDQSPAQPGTGCVSDESITQWMEYLHMQHPFPTNSTGVPIRIDVLDANDNYRNIGTAISDPSGTFGFSWKPDIPGQYKVIATFAGSGSYGSSYAVTYFNVMEAPEPTAAPTPTPPSMAEQYFVPATVGMVVAIVAVGAVLALLMLRKRP
jgi:hypothetical protein